MMPFSVFLGTTLEDAKCISLKKFLFASLFLTHYISWWTTVQLSTLFNSVCLTTTCPNFSSFRFVRKKGVVPSPTPTHSLGPSWIALRTTVLDLHWCFGPCVACRWRSWWTRRRRSGPRWCRDRSPRNTRRGARTCCSRLRSSRDCSKQRRRRSAEILSSSRRSEWSVFACFGECSGEILIGWVTASADSIFGKLRHKSSKTNYEERSPTRSAGW